MNEIETLRKNVETLRDACERVLKALNGKGSIDGRSQEMGTWKTFKAILQDALKETK